MNLIHERTRSLVFHAPVALVDLPPPPRKSASINTSRKQAPKFQIRGRQAEELNHCKTKTASAAATVTAMETMKLPAIVILLLVYVEVEGSAGIKREAAASTAAAAAPEGNKGKCITPEMVDGVEEKWVDDFSQSPGLYNSISYQFNEWRSTVNFPPPPPVDKHAKHNRCWKVFMKTPNGPFEEFRSTCTYYNDVARQQCRLETTGTSLNGVFRHYGTFQIVMTDQQTYMVVYACLLGSKNYFMTLSRTSSLPEATQAKIEDYLVNKLKFDKNYVVYNSTNAEMAIQKIEMIECHGAAPAFPHWPAFDWGKMFKFN